jgi:hypothetical protein
MARFKTPAAVAVFLFGTTFLWFMPSFLGPGTTAHGAIWSLVQLLVVATVVALAVAAWGVHKALAWWKPVALAGALAGAAVLPLWWIAVSSVSGVTNMAANLALHAIGTALLLVVLLVPSLAQGLDRRLGAHQAEV